jgi:FdhD protein
LLSSRISVEMVQKAAIFGAPVVAAISAPTSLAIDVANRAGMTLIGIARSDGFEVFTHPHRIDPAKARHVA